MSVPAIPPIPPAYLSVRCSERERASALRGRKVLSNIAACDLLLDIAFWTIVSVFVGFIIYIAY